VPQWESQGFGKVELPRLPALQGCDWGWEAGDLREVLAGSKRHDQEGTIQRGPRGGWWQLSALSARRLERSAAAQGNLAKSH
jgi:hypothetical protein